MRITIICQDFKGYLENPRNFLPSSVKCIRNPDHCTHHKGHWQRKIVVEHAFTTNMLLFRWHCLECGESISVWPEFVLPYQMEPATTHEHVLVDCINGKTYAEVAEKLGYDVRSIARWAQRMMRQALFLSPMLIPEMMKSITCSLLPLGVGGVCAVVSHLLAWLYQYAKFMGFNHFLCLIALANLLSRGRFIIWGGEIGRCRYGREFCRASSG